MSGSAFGHYDDDFPPEEPAPDRRAGLLDGLTEAQKRAVLTTEGPVLVLAAAGSGKTRVLTRRVAHLLACGVPGWSILALTFTNKASAEMRQRVGDLVAADPELGPRALRGLTVTTFHALGARLLRRFADRAGLKPEFTIYDTSDQTSLLKKTLEALQLSSSNWPARSVLSTISAAKNELLDPAAYAARASDFFSRTIAKVYASYDKALRGAGAVDFDDLLVLTAKLLRDDAEARRDCRERWRYLLIDEYQDTNHAQFVIASLLAGGEEAAATGQKGPNIFVVGDPDQAIYGWRGADITNILEFEEHYPSATVITLGENFRSTEPILAVADTLIRNNKLRKHKDLFTSTPGGDHVEVTICRDERHEADLVVDWLRRLHEHTGEGTALSSGLAWREMAILYRTNALSRVMEDALRAAAIPYVIARGTAFYEREEVRNALAYLRVVANAADTVSLLRIVNTPARGLGTTSLSRLEGAADLSGAALFDVLRNADRVEGVSARAAASAARFVTTVEGWTGQGSFMGADVPSSLAELVERVIRESGLEAMYKQQAAAGKSEADLERLDNLSELVSSARQFELEFDAGADPALGNAELVRSGDAATPPLLAVLRAYLESVSLVADADVVDPSQGAVTLLTLHAAKGLEFPAVAIIGLEEGMLPHVRALQDERQLEEERRLCFVGITRAMRRLAITAAKYRTIRGTPERTIPSRFLEEIGDTHAAFSDQSDPLAGLGGTSWDPVFDDAPQVRTRREFGGGREHAGAGVSGAYPVGSLVRHPQFGLGRVRNIIGGPSARAVVDFQAVGTKTLVLEYARLQRVQ